MTAFTLIVNYLSLLRHNSVALLTLISYPIKIRHYFLSCEGLLVLLRNYPRQIRNDTLDKTLVS
jgi:hypothetical protein